MIEYVHYSQSSLWMMEYTGPLRAALPLRKTNSIMKRYSSKVPPCFETSSPAALAEPPGTYLQTLL
jgi:hypothetical protein